MWYRSLMLAMMLIELTLIFAIWQDGRHGRDVNRFQPVSGAPELALDSKTGRLCYAFDPLPGIGSDRIPLCEKLK